MQRETSISSHGNSSVSTLPFTGEYDFAPPPSMYSSIFPPNHSSILDYLNDGSSNFSSTESEDAAAALAPYLPQFHQQQQLLNQDLMNRHRTVLSHLRDVAKQAKTLRQENVNLKMTNLDLNNRLNQLLNPAPFHGVDVDPGLDNLEERLRKLGVEEEGTSENEAVAKSPTSVMDSGQGRLGGTERVHLPKSISVRSNGYLKAGRVGVSDAKVVKASNQNNGTQKVYVKGGKKEQAVEVEVFNQGMFKTELCNKWQQTGACPYRENCQFAHGIDELRPVLRHPRYKTEVCRMVLNGVSCPYGHRCHFRHTLTEQEQLVQAMNSKSLEPMSYR
ncbi:hypothetical protein C2S53_017170 [Perilla frutescens var. hirtella]|uniref:C3H1-type domain-containing protein n=1 Tax=Perilla frutescens var. hirtella TaxID=608512 RepID=A0AAD4J6M8_PERFH|nr:hypothetical protein C2S53_017170 [Perilla frutescens var. hirtella]